MAILDIKKFPNPVLKKKSEPVKEITEEIRILGQNILETMEKNEGIGLAASQVGELKRVIVVQSERGPEVFINPKIVKKSRENEIIEEGCLSFPELFLKIKRVKETEIEALNLAGRKVQIKAEGLLARIFQHEIDHLDGILIIDKIPFWKKLWLYLKS